MENWQHDFTTMSDFLEAEAQGRPFDRRHASELASRLADTYPEIRHTMHLVRDRLRDGARH